ncbi:7-cyano-7-deazaguanine synthase [Methanothermococcus okinawensis]|uniref:Queuosine synthesis-like protein n=1 Tax=Methanothermococcus okinawensis (strain DSM 14208 / JCM 11175 / IH1) TaxID=647113 RepID=F8ANI8_METOI|nr:7-cyano-7-deazaguanine synthase [Methanothermococcus okinawensis]AEH07042.1 Queuosine synthesis-like protein [Methanothermococcus okinawensis IH1]
MENNVIFTQWTQIKRNLKDLNQLKKDIIKNFEENNLKDKKIVSMLSGGKDSSTALHIAKDLGLDVCLCVHFVHKWSWNLAKEQAKKIADKLDIPIIFYDITGDLKKRTKGAKGGSICRICKDIMKDKIIEIAKDEGAEIILTGDTALEKISGPIFQHLRETYGTEKFDKMELTPVPKRYNKMFFRPLIRCGYDDVIKLKNYYGLNIERIHEVGDKFGYWREGCPLQYCDYDTTITEELLDNLYHYNKKITELARKYRFRASIKLPSKELMIVPNKKEYVNMVKKYLYDLYKI